MSPTVDPSAAEREPDHATPDCSDGWHFSRQQPTKPCPTCGDVADYAADQLLDRERKAPAEPERRTVSLEVLTDEHRGFAAGTVWGGTVAVVLRVNGEIVGIPEVDTYWSAAWRQPADILSQMLRSARTFANDRGDDQPPADVLMPTPDVLAALDGRGRATNALWTAVLTVRAEQVQVGWLAVDYAAAGVSDPVTAVDECKDDKCPWHGNCAVITAGGETIHWATWQTFDVRIPCGVTR